MLRNNLEGHRVYIYVNFYFFKNKCMKQNLERKLDSINELLKCCVDKKGHHYCDYAKLTDVQAKILSEISGVDLRGYKRVITTDDILHAFNTHCKDKCPVTLEDFLLIPYVCENYDWIEKGGIAEHTKCQCIRYKKEIGDTYFVVEEIRTGRNKLAFKTLYKKAKRSFF